MWYSGRRIPVARVQSFLKTFKLETHYRCRWVARARRHVCAVTKADHFVAGSLSLKSLEHVKSLSRWPEILNMEEALINTYRMYTVLYDMTLKDYKNEKMKLNVWEKIAEELQHVKGCCVQGMGVDEHLYMPTVWLVNHDTSWYMVWKPDKSHCCMFLFSLCTLRFEFDCVFAAYLPLGRWSPCRWALATQW